MSAHHLTPTARRGIVLAVTLGALVLGACGGSSDGDAAPAASGGDAAETATDDTASADTVAELATLFSENDFAPACRGTGIDAASAYDEAAALRPIVVLAGEDPDYSFSTVRLPDGWQTQFETYETTQLVACLDRTTATPVELCEGYEDSDSGLTWSIQTFDVSWALTLREAATGTVVAESTFEAPNDGCPTFSFYTEGDPLPVPDYADPGADLEVFLKTFVNP